MSRFSLRRATRIIALDRFMRDRILAKGISADKLVVLPPWSLDAHVRFDPAGREAFRKRHGLDGKFVVMYSGNHSPVHPLGTLLETARRLAPIPAWCFVSSAVAQNGAEFGGTMRLETEGSRTKETKEPKKTSFPHSQLSTLNSQLT